MSFNITVDGMEYILPFKFQICPCCEGHGQNSLHLGAFTAEDMDEQGPQFLEDYMAGVYDQECEPCKGSGKIKVVDRKRVMPHILAAWDQEQEEEDDYHAMCAAERRMGC